MSDIDIVIGRAKDVDRSYCTNLRDLTGVGTGHERAAGKARRSKVSVSSLFGQGKGHTSPTYGNWLGISDLQARFNSVSLNEIEVKVC